MEIKDQTVRKDFEDQLRQRVETFLEAAGKVERIILDTQERQGRKPGEGILLGELSDEERASFLEINKELLRTSKKAFRFLAEANKTLYGEGDVNLIGQMEHDLRRPEIAYFSVIAYLDARNKIGEEYEEKFQAEVRQRASWVESVFIRHSIRVIKSFEGEVSGKPEKKEFEVAKIIGDVVEILRANSDIGLFDDTPKGSVTVNFNTGEHVFLSGRENDLYRVFYNILRNSEKILARNFEENKKRGVIDINVEETESGKRVVINMADNGPGIDAEAVLKSAIKAGKITAEESKKLSEEEKLQLIFLPGVTGFAEIGIRDTGMGLAICKRIIDEHSGTIKIESKTGTGTKFVIDLPKK